ncbi:MAG: hypothetical protein LBH25_00795 [Fibromonadaceae bacterium]|jgi:hypothetical protein|nr:hypothetical protein [Fibromonadaceae bacterium]
MEALLIFLAIAAVQMIAAYSKQKKEAAKKAAKQNAPPQEASPIPDPFKEIRKAMGLPPAIEETPESEPDPEFDDIDPELDELELEPVLPRESFVPDRLPFQSITNRKAVASIESANDSEIQASKKNHKLNVRRIVDINEPAHGILWTAILQEPRYRAKWKPKCYR